MLRHLLSTTITVASLWQLVFVPTPQTQYGQGGGMVMLGPTPRPLPPQFSAPQFNMGQGVTPMTRPQPVMPRPPIQ